MRDFLFYTDRWLNRLYNACGYLAAMFLVAIGVLVMANILSRLFSVYVPGLTEYSGYSMAASSFLALAYTFRHKGHIRVELFLSHLSEKWRRFGELWCLGVAVVVCGFLSFYFIRLVYFSWEFQERSEGADAVLLWIPQSLAMFGACVLFVCVSHQLVRELYLPDTCREPTDG